MSDEPSQNDDLPINDLRQGRWMTCVEAPAGVDPVFSWLKRFWAALWRALADGGTRFGALTVRARRRDADWASDALLDAAASGGPAAETALSGEAHSIALTSHELRTPLNGILGMADLLNRTALSPEQESYVQAITTSATALLSLVDDMLDVGRIAAGRWRVKPRPMAIETLVEEVVELLAPRAQAKGLELAAHVASQVPESVSADPDQLMRILMNLAGNAIKFTDRGGVAIDVCVEREAGQTVSLAFRVRDTGIGIAAADQPRLFNEYEQADAGATPRPAGTGLGLAIARAIARAMGGDIALQSQPGIGSVFSLSVDLPVLSDVRHRDRPLQGRHLLLISDRPVEPPVLMRRLFDLGASVELARDLPAAHAVLEEARPIDVILFDQGPGLDASDFLDGATRAMPPVVAMLTPADRDQLNRLKAAGVRAHLVKPMRTRSLTRVVAAVLSGAAVMPVPIEPAPGDTARPPQPAAIAPMKILLADDNDINLLLGRSLLQSLGFEVDVARDGAAAVALAGEAIATGGDYDAILMDLHMPIVDGFAAIERIRAMDHAAGARPVIVALTADNTEHTARRAIAAGADFALTKPMQPHHLVDGLAAARAARHGDPRLVGGR